MQLSGGQLRARRIRAARIIGENGKWFHPECPPRMHGRSSGATYWCCECDACLEYRHETMRVTHANRKHNREVLAQLKAQKEAQLLDAAGAEEPTTPEEVGTDSGPVDPPADAPGTPDEVDPTPQGHLSWSEYKRQIQARLSPIKRH